MNLPDQSRSRLLPLLTGLLALLGAGSLIAAGYAAAGTPAAWPAVSQPAPSTVRSVPAPTQPATTATGPAASGERPVAELADPIWVARIAETGGIPARAMAAYAGAALATAETDPGCGLGWNTLAAIGHVESEHGSIDGSTIAEDGVARPPIIGIPLDGSKGVARIPDTDRGELDQDTTWDRAVGPMQFIPATWTAHAQDGNRDGIADIHNLDDAALTAAAYLCTTGGDLTIAQNWIKAIAAYNPDAKYNHSVAAAAKRYAGLR